jgi:hypothetical protein
MGKVVPAYVCRQTACRELDMSDETFDKYVREGTLPQPSRSGGMGRSVPRRMVVRLLRAPRGVFQQCASVSRSNQ